MDRRDLLEKFNRIVRPAPRSAGFTPAPEDRGAGAMKRIKRLYRYRGAYLTHIGRQIRLRLDSMMPEKTAPAVTFWGRKLMLPLRDVNAQSIRESGTIDANEDGLVRYLIRELRPEDVFYDIGANYGFYSALAQELTPEGEVHAFEPGQLVFTHLLQLGEGHTSTFLTNAALSDATGTVTFLDCYDGHASGKSTIEAGIAANHRWNYKTTTAPATTLDEYAKSHRPPTFIKMDVEGAEQKVLSGGMHLLEASAPVIATELWSGPELSMYSRKVIATMRKLGYLPFFITREGSLEETTYPHLETWLATDQAETNFLFKKATIPTTK